MSESLYIRQSCGQISGPHSADVVRSMIAHGELKPFWELSTDQVDWSIAEELLPEEFAAPAIQVRLPAPRPRSAHPGNRPHAAVVPGLQRPVRPAKNSLFIIGCTLILGGFFLPWVDVTIIKFSGYDIPGTVNSLANLTRKLGGAFGSEFATKDLPSFAYLYLLYLIPMIAGFGIYLEAAAVTRLMKSRALKAVIGLAPILIMLLVNIVGYAQLEYLETNEWRRSNSSFGAHKLSDALEFIGFGVWVTLLGVILATAAAWVTPRRKSLPQGMER